jgi:8-hydroxy-5-deazaflavin:NADPH oxidoreductase
MKIAILGAGNIGGTMGRKWAAAGHQVLFGVRNSSSPKTQAALQSAGGNAKAMDMREAISTAEVVLFSVPWAAVPEIAATHSAELAGKIILDATNNFAGPVINRVDILQKTAPSAQVYRAFNSLGWDLFADPEIHGTQVDHFFTGPDGAARQKVEQLIAEVGVRPIWVGENQLVTLVDSLGLLWVNLARQQGMGRHIALKLLS